MAHTDQDIGQAIRAHRERHQRLSQAAVADRMAKAGHAWHQATVYKIENNQRILTALEAVSLAQILGVSIPELLGLETGSEFRAGYNAGVIAVGEKYSETLNKIIQERKR